jgi:hypothetical protein
VTNVTWDLKWSAKVFNPTEGSEVLTAVVMKCCILWAITPCRQQAEHFVLVLLFGFLLISWGGVRLSPLGMSATSWPIVPVPDDR